MYNFILSTCITVLQLSVFWNWNENVFSVCDKNMYTCKTWSTGVAKNWHGDSWHSQLRSLASTMSSWSISRSFGVCWGEIGSPSNVNCRRFTGTSRAAANAVIAFPKGSIYGTRRKIEIDSTTCKLACHTQQWHNYTAPTCTDSILWRSCNLYKKVWKSTCTPRDQNVHENPASNVSTKSLFTLFNHLS